jgi:hypothetical protein
MFDSSPLLICALTANKRFPVLMLSGWLFPMMSLIGPEAPLGAGIVNSFSGFSLEIS